MNYFLDVIKNHYVDFKGRARRKEYWMYTLFNFLAILIFYALFFAAAYSQQQTLMYIISGILWLYCLGLILPSLGVAIRRLHDIGKSGWWLFVSLIPAVGGIILLVFSCTDSVPGNNEYGPNPKGIN
jgi:uncharacterized membrane protein YhaH (DUF805 family)